MSKAKSSESTIDKVKRLALKEHSDLRFVTEGRIEGLHDFDKYVVATDTGIFYYDSNGRSLDLLSQVLWIDVKDIKVDHLAMRTNLTLNGQTYRLNSKGKMIFNLANEKSNASVEKVERKWHQKILGFRSGARWKKITAVIGYLLLFGFIGSMFTETEEAAQAEKKVAPEKVVATETEKETAEEKEVSVEIPPKQSEAEKAAELEAAKKAEEEKAAAAKAEAEQKVVAEKEYYLSDIKSKVDTQMDMYDEAWDTLWIPTFNGISDGSVDIYTAYENMKQLEQRYETLQSSIPAIPDEKLSEENKKTFSDFRDQMASAAMWRASAAEKTQAMFDSGDFSPSTMDEVKIDVESADSEMLSAVVSLTSLEMELGVEREE